MEINVSKSELAGALSALGKLVCRTSPVEAFRSVQIEGKENKITLKTANTEESIAFSMAAEAPESFAVLVNFDDFRTVVRGGRNKMLTLTVEEGRFAVDGLILPQVSDTLPVQSTPGNDCINAVLPAGFVGMLATAAPIVDRSNYRKILQGIHLCPKGIVVTNGKELLHIEAPMEIVPLTIPFPLALLATKCEGGGTIFTWTDQGNRYFRMENGGWTWQGKALAGMYPNWHLVIPEAKNLSHAVSFDEAQAETLATFLKSAPANPPNNPVTLYQNDGKLEVSVSEENKSLVAAEFSESWGDFSIVVNSNILQRLLQEGHRRLAFADERGPFMASGGIGTYVAMPLFVPNKTQQEEKEMNETENPNNLTRSTETRNPAGVSIGTCGARGPQTNAVKPERSEGVSAIARNAAFSGESAVTAPVPSVASPINPEPVIVNPLDDLAAAIDGFKTRIRAMFDESAILSRKVKEVALSQKQKERDFIQAKRAIERIRMAI